MSDTLQRKRFDHPDEVRKPGNGTAEVVNIGGFGLMHVTLNPGWRWSQDVKPMAHTDSCQSKHVLQISSGHLHVVHNDGSEEDFGPGDLGFISPGHDAWVVGDEPVVYLDITGSGVPLKSAAPDIGSSTP